MQIPDLTKVRLNNVTAATSGDGGGWILFRCSTRARQSSGAGVPIDGKRIALYESYCSSGRYRY